MIVEIVREIYSVLGAVLTKNGSFEPVERNQPEPAVQRSAISLPQPIAYAGEDQTEILDQRLAAD